MARKKEITRIPTTNIRREQIMGKCNGICCHCGAKLILGDNFSIEHVIPLNKGGTNEFKNIVSLCKACNKEKSDDVVDVGYYAFAPKLVKEQISELLDQYYNEHDWLTELNVFKHDRFTVRIERTIMLKNGKIYKKPGVCEVKKMTMEEFKDFVENTETAKSNIEFIKPESDDEVETLSMSSEGTTYRIIFGNKTIAAFLCNLTPGTGKGTGINGRGVFRILIAISPDITWGPSSRMIIADCIREIITQFSDSMLARKTKALLFVCVDAFADDKRGVDFIRTFSRISDVEMSILTDHETDEPVYVRHTSVLGFGVEVSTDDDDKIKMDEFVKKEKLYSGQLRRRLSSNG